MEKIPICGQENRAVVLCLGKNISILRSLTVRSAKIEYLVSHPFEQACGGLWEILIQEEFHATASYADAW